MLTYTKISTVTVGAGGAATISFSNIPQTFTDLVVMFSGRAATGSTVSMGCSFNGDIAANYSSKELSGSGSSVSSFSPSYSPNNGVSGADVSMSTDTANTFANSMLYISGYSSSTKYKSTSLDSVTENNGTAAYAILSAGIWNSTAPITSMSFLIYNSYSFAQYSSATLYGIGYQPKATGGTISSDGTYWYHAFTSTGLFTPSKNLQCDVLVVAGGGGGGTEKGGGGGAGGFVYSASKSLANGTAYNATVGAGGPATINGSNSSLTGGSLSLTAAIGGGYGTSQNSTYSSGGSGGGGSGYTEPNTAHQTGNGTGTSGQGNNGGQGYRNSNTSFAAGGGGGAGAIGTDATSGGAGGAGGAGTSAYSSWGSVTSTGQNVSGTYYYAAGGGGGGSVSSANGGNGGGGNGTYTGTATAGTANTGGGGGGGGTAASSTGGAGGSGVVIIRYKI